jgi:hypothetical protein
MTAQLVARCNGDANDVLKAARSVMCAVLVRSRDRWPSDDEWRSLLPEWFVGRCAREKSKEEMASWLEWWRGLPQEQQAKANQENWSLSSWLEWFKPGERQWAWWSAFAENHDCIRVTVTVDDWPFAWGALEWLFIASGAESVFEE